METKQWLFYIYLRLKLPKQAIQPEADSDASHTKTFVCGKKCLVTRYSDIK